MNELTAALEAMHPMTGMLVFCAVAALASMTIAALIAFVVARYVLRARIEKLARRNATFKALDQAVAKEAWKVIALVRMSPVLPSGVKSYFLGVTPGVALKVYLGAAGRGALSAGSRLDWALLAAGILATIALTVIVGRKVRSRPKL